MAAEWVGRCVQCNKWRAKHDTYMVATERGEDGKPTSFVMTCGFCSTSIQRKCCASGCPHCVGTGMMPRPQPPTIQCELCPQPSQTKRGSKFLCNACDHEVMWGVKV